MPLHKQVGCFLGQSFICSRKFHLLTGLNRRMYLSAAPRTHLTLYLFQQGFTVVLKRSGSVHLRTQYHAAQFCQAPRLLFCSLGCQHLYQDGVQNTAQFLQKHAEVKTAHRQGFPPWLQTLAPAMVVLKRIGVCLVDMLVCRQHARPCKPVKITVHTYHKMSVQVGNIAHTHRLSSLAGIRSVSAVAGQELHLQVRSGLAKGVLPEGNVLFRLHPGHHTHSVQQTGSRQITGHQGQPLAFLFATCHWYTGLLCK